VALATGTDQWVKLDSLVEIVGPDAASAIQRIADKADKDKVRVQKGWTFAKGGVVRVALLQYAVRSNDFSLMDAIMRYYCAVEDRYVNVGTPKRNRDDAPRIQKTGFPPGVVAFKQVREDPTVVTTHKRRSTNVSRPANPGAPSRVGKRGFAGLVDRLFCGATQPIFGQYSGQEHFLLGWENGVPTFSLFDRSGDTMRVSVGLFEREKAMAVLEKAEEVFVCGVMGPNITKYVRGQVQMRKVGAA
jgi:hypothetical protein